MKGYVNIPNSIFIRSCKHCGARPIIAMVTHGEYVVKCPMSDNHYHTQPGLIDLDAWNRNNKIIPAGNYQMAPVAFI